MVRGRADVRSTEQHGEVANDTLDNHSYPDMNPSDVHVLAVDDSIIDRKVIEKMLKTSSYRVTTVESVSRALDVLGVGESRTSVAVNAYQINFIITDYCMPGMTGYDLLKRVKGISDLKEIPVVIMSSENVPTRIKRCLAEGAEEFILKPVRLADVKRLVYQTRLNVMGQSAAPRNKKKIATESFGVPNSGRRPSLNGVTVS